MAGYPVKDKTMRSDTHLPYIPHEIIHSCILGRLPAKSLARFRCVSKLWNATIGDPKFVKSHALGKSLRILALYRHGSNYRTSRAYDFITQDDSRFYSNTAMLSIQIVGHCNGLFCFRNNRRNLIILCNPCTRECLDHPLPPPPPPDHPSISYGFGFDSSRNEYKAVEIVHANFSLYRCMVYTFGAKNNSWRDITVQVNLSRHFKRCVTWGAVSSCRALYVNATLFWFFSDPWLFMAFDLRSEDFSFFEGPITRSDLCASTSFLIDWQGSMCLGFQNLSAKNVHLYVYNSCRQDADRWHFKQVEVPSSYIWQHGALGADSIFYALRGKELLLYSEGLDRCFYDLAGSELTTKFPRALGESGLMECQFTYHVENFLSLKTMQRSPPTRFHRAGVKMLGPAN